MALCLVSSPAATTIIPPDPSVTIGRMIPLDGFVDETGRPLVSGDAGDERPWIVSPIYTRCPQTCTPLTNALHAALGTAGLGPLDYRVVSLSIDPAETAEGLAAFRTRLALPPGWRTVRATDPLVLGRTLRALDFRTITVADGILEHPNLVAVLGADRRLVGYVLGVRPDAGELAAAVKRARGGPGPLDRWRPVVTGVAAVGFVSSGIVLVALLARRSGRRKTARASNC